MGMFDTIYCDLDLPGLGKFERSFQTKDIYSCLDTYRITNEGKLFRELDSFNKEDKKEIPFHGFIQFYTGDGDWNNYTWLEFKAKFTDGICINIIRIPGYKVVDKERIYDEGYKEYYEANKWNR